MRCIVVIAIVAGACQGGASIPATHRRVIEVHEARGTVTARIVPGHPCRATVDGTELLVGGRPLIAQLGATRWTGDDDANGTTIKRNDATVARIHANQLFDAQGMPLVRVMDNGDVANPAGQIVRKAVVTSGAVPSITFIPSTTGGEVVTVTGVSGGSDEFALAAMLTVPKLDPEIRALAACHYLLPETKL